ncbi:uncharacterized protein J8A68_003385 [[Candida] subhashii]|uniref:Endonuclease/exonuclease/phosphatase domain-containing protein n=1 Tax=[Candida] subhashii TaxID=561895 RepID=A0A8J5QMJ7_9ASCO|nr:uncharacterized protein J8A68_003385 [[Candida] subhashii]KAG7663113.1 hypothetical protein J8A68_003385 [[Candida] subhashii]
MGFTDEISKKVNQAVLKAKDKLHDHQSSNSTTYNRPAAATPQGNCPIQLQFYTHNIRQDAKNRMENERTWPERMPGVVRLIRYVSSSNPTLVGLQEVKNNQLNDIMRELGREWTYFGVGRDDGKKKGEYSPILFKNSDFELLSGKTYWLSDTPDRVSKGWDAAFERIVTKVSMRHRQSGKVINFFNTHYDHRGKVAREKSSFQILDLMKKSQGINVLAGDFNSEPKHEAYKTLEKSLIESSKGCRQRAGFEHTVTGFTLGKKESSIDFIWVTPNIPILYHEVLDQTYGNYLCSDHRPVRAIIEV